MGRKKEQREEKTVKQEKNFQDKRQPLGRRRKWKIEHGGMVRKRVCGVAIFWYIVFLCSWEEFFGWMDGWMDGWRDICDLRW